MSTDRSKLPKDRLLQPTTAKWFAVIFGASVLYAIVRYHIAGDVEWRHFPLFILNKAMSLAAVFFVASSYMIGKVIHWHDHDKDLRLVVIKFCGLMGFFMAAIHAFFSFALLTPAYFAKYFDDVGKLNLQGEVAISVGVLALFVLLAPALTSLPMMPKALGGIRWKRNQRMGYAALAFVLVHLIFLGVKGWIEPSGWQGWLPPISLIAAIAAMIPILVMRKYVLDARDRSSEHNDRLPPGV